MITLLTENLELRRELDYLRKLVNDYEGVVKQLVDGPGEIEYIHPYDFYELLDKATLKDFWIRNDVVEYPAGGKKYKQTTCIPARTKRFQ